MKPIRPAVNYDALIYYLTLISIFVRIASITFIFLLICYAETYEAILKQTILKSVCVNVNSEVFLDKSVKANNDKSRVSSRFSVKTAKDNGLTSVNNHDSNYTSHYSEDKNLCEETTIRVNMDELNEKIKAGEIFSDNRSSRASNANAYNLII